MVSAILIATCFGCVVVVAKIFYLVVGIMVATWISDFDKWGDELQAILDTNFSCSHEATLYNLVEDIEIFSTFSIIFLIASIYYIIAICCQIFGATSDYKCCRNQIVLCCNYLIHQVSIIMFIWQYYIVIDLLESLIYDTDACDTEYEDTLDESIIYHDNLTDFPISLITFCWVTEIISIFCMAFCCYKLEQEDGEKTEGDANATVGANAERRVVPVATGGSRAPTRANEPTDEEMKRAMVLVSAVVVMKCGFEFATRNNCDEAMRKLNGILPSRQTHLRDAIAVGIYKMVDLKEKLERVKALDHNFIHIVLTDGMDTGSNISEYEFYDLQRKLEQAQLSDICKTIFVGVGLNNAANTKLRDYSRIGGENCDFYNCDTMDIEKIFNHISLSLIQNTRIAAMQTSQGMVVVGQRQRGIEFGLNHFLVLLTLDMSGSMAGTRWGALKRAVHTLIENLKSTDIFGIVLFNDTLKVITGAQE